MTEILGVLGGLIGLIMFVLNKRYSQVAMDGRKRHERDKAIAEYDTDIIGVHLAELHGRVREKNRRTSGQ